jgi:hypothetical protein
LALNGEEWDYRTVLVSSLGRVGYPGGTPANLQMKQIFNFTGISRIAMKTFRWKQGYTGSSTYSVYLASDALTYWDADHYINNLNLGGDIFDAVPIGLSIYSTAGNIYEYAPTNLNWHIFSEGNSIQSIDIRMLTYNGIQLVPDGSVSGAMEFEMELLIGTRKTK